MALLATTIFACSNEDNEDTKGTETNLKSLDFSFDVTSPKTRMSDDQVPTTDAYKEVRNNIKSITIEYFNASGTSLGTHDFTNEQIQIAKGDDQAAADNDRKAVRINSIPSATEKVNVYMNVNTATDINALQLVGYKTMEYRGTPQSIKLKTAGSERADATNDLYSVEVSVMPVMSRFEFRGTATDIAVNKDGDNKLPAGVTNGELTAVQGKVSTATITAAEKAAQEAWRKANPGAADPTWALTYTLTYAYDAAYTIESIDGYYMNNIPLTKGDATLTLNANNGSGNWDTTASDNYKEGGNMAKMFDTSVDAGKVIAYNLFPQTATNAATATVADVKASMPHFILKLTTKAGDGTTSPRWLTIRALKTTAAGEALITSFEAGKAYVLNATDININQYSANLKVTANGTVGPEIPEPVDPTDPNPEPVGKDLDVLVKIMDWTIVNVKPEW